MIEISLTIPTKTYDDKKNGEIAGDINKLPAALFQYVIFPLLGLRERAGCRLVCKYWKVCVDSCPDDTLKFAIDEKLRNINELYNSDIPNIYELFESGNPQEIFIKGIQDIIQIKGLLRNSWTKKAVNERSIEISALNLYNRIKPFNPKNCSLVFDAFTLGVMMIIPLIAYLPCLPVIIPSTVAYRSLKQKKSIRVIDAIGISPCLAFMKSINIYKWIERDLKRIRQLKIAVPTREYAATRKWIRSLEKAKK